MGLHPVLASSFLICLLVQGVAAQKEVLFSEVNGYNPLPSPDGKLVAFVEKGWGRSGGSGGFGRSNLVSEVNFATWDGEIIGSQGIDSFISEWLPDSSALVCYRDWRFGLASTGGWLQQDAIPGATEPRSERVGFLSSMHRFVWIDRQESKTLLQTPQGPIGEFDYGLGKDDLIVPSSDGRYLAITGNGSHLFVFDLQKKHWADLGEVTVHPSRDWDYVNPSWNPWFSDSSRLVYVSQGTLYTAAPDGTQKSKVARVNNAGLPVPSPDGKRIAFVSFTPRPMKTRPDLTFWGGAVVWTVPSSGGKPTRETQATNDTTYSLRWLGNSTLIFDRLRDELFYSHARIWKVPLAER